MKVPYLRHLKSSDDLVTTYEQVRAGFVALALERNRRATPFVEEARALKTAASRADCPAALLKIPAIQSGLLTAAGVSEKAASHMTDADKLEAVQGLIATFLEPAGAAFVEELVFRFLLTRGDALGGSMRNIGGALAQRKLTRALIASLRLAGITYTWLHSANEKWLTMEEDDADVELHLRGLSWSSGRRGRTLIYNFTVPLVENNVDFCLLDGTAEIFKAACGNPKSYIALGELKGGIDPAGADEPGKQPDQR